MKLVKINKVGSLPSLTKMRFIIEEEKDNEHGKHAVAIIYDSFHSNNFVRQIPLYWRELANKFLKFLNHHIRIIVTGKRVNRGIGLGLEIPIDYFFHGDNRILKWFKKSIERLDKCSTQTQNNAFFVNNTQ